MTGWQFHVSSIARFSQNFRSNFQTGADFSMFTTAQVADQHDAGFGVAALR